MGFPRQEYWSGLPCPPPGHLPDLGIEPAFPALQTDLSLSHWEAPRPNHPRGGESNLSMTSTASGGHQLLIYSRHTHSNHTQQNPVPTDAANFSFMKLKNSRRESLAGTGKRISRNTSVTQASKWPLHISTEM